MIFVKSYNLLAHFTGIIKSSGLRKMMDDQLTWGADPQKQAHGGNGASWGVRQLKGNQLDFLEFCLNLCLIEFDLRIPRDRFFARCR